MKRYILFMALVSVFGLMMTGCQEQNSTSEIPILEYSAWDGMLTVKNNEDVKKYGVTLEFFQTLVEENIGMYNTNMTITISNESNSESYRAKYWQNGSCNRIEKGPVEESIAPFEEGDYWITSYSGDEMEMECVSGSKTLTLDLKRKSML